MRRTLLVGVLLCALVGAGGAWYWWRDLRYVESTDDAFVQADISAISPNIQGYVREVRVTDNEPVKAGDVLIVIDDRDAVAKLAEAQATVDAERAVIATLATRRIWQQAMIEQAAAAVDSAEAELHRTTLDLGRQRDLRRVDVGSRQQLETAEADQRKAEALRSRTEAALLAERDQIAVIDAEQKQEQAKLNAAEARLRLAQNDVDDTLIRAPVDGVVGNKGVQIGQYVKPGTLLMAIVPLPRVYVIANFKETQLAAMHPGQPVTLSIDAFPGARLRGFVESFAPASGALFSLLPPENATGNFTKIVQRIPVRIALAPDEPLRERLRPGLSAVVDVDTRPQTKLAAAATEILR